MGDRASLNLKYGEDGMVCFYTHWRGEELSQTLQEALKRGRERWDDPSYLARVIFSQMLLEDEGSLEDLTGYGISPTPIARRAITVYLDRGEVEIKGKVYSFKEYVALSEFPF